MKLSVRLFLAYFLIVGVGMYWIIDNLSNQLHPAIRQASEETLVDTANLLAELAAEDMAVGFIEIGNFSDAVELYRKRELDAQIWSFTKEKPNFIVYITNRQGKVVFHTDKKEVGKDYSRWIDVNRTLRGLYGARTTRAIPGNELSSFMYVAAPIRFNGKLIGSLTVAKPNASVQPVMEIARDRIWQQGMFLLVLALVIGAVSTYWLTKSIRKLSEYVEDVRAGLNATPPKLREKELANLAASVESMRQALEGKEYVENYIHTLTHEMKSPLAAIRGASELLQESSMPAEEQERFLKNIHNESDRMKSFIDRLLSLANVENRKSLDKPSAVDLSTLLEQELDAKSHLLLAKNITAVKNINADKLEVMGERFLLQQALSNVLDNAIDFSEKHCNLNISLENPSPELIRINVSNIGPAIPDYAKQRIFERFYSLSRPSTGRKSSGLGLSFVQEVAQLHKGEIHLDNTEQGVMASITLPCIS